MLLKVISNSITLTSVHGVLHLELVFLVILYCEIRKSHYVSLWPCHSVLTALLPCNFIKDFSSVCRRCVQGVAKLMAKSPSTPPLLIRSLASILHIWKSNTTVCNVCLLFLNRPSQLSLCWKKWLHRGQNSEKKLPCVSPQKVLSSRNDARRCLLIGYLVAGRQRISKPSIYISI